MASGSVGFHVDCSECGKKRLCVLLQVCVPANDDEHEKILDISMCRECVTKMGTLGMWIADAVRSHFARARS